MQLVLFWAFMNLFFILNKLIKNGKLIVFSELYVFHFEQIFLAFKIILSKLNLLSFTQNWRNFLKILDPRWKLGFNIPQIVLIFPFSGWNFLNWIICHFTARKLEFAGNIEFTLEINNLYCKLGLYFHVIPLDGDTR